MKNLFVLLCLILFLNIPVFAEYKPIPKNMSKQYKAEIEQTIDSKYIHTAQKINNIALDANKMYKRVLKNKRLYNKFCNKQFDIIIDAPEFYLFLDLINITKKYVSLSDDDIPATDWSGTLYEFMLPYFNDNGIKTKKLDDLGKLTGAKQQEIEKYYQKANELIYPN